MAESWLVALNTVRNCCAHHSRLWNKTLGTKPMIPRDDTAWHEPHEVGNHKMFGTLTVLSYMLETIAPATSWRSRLLDLMEERLPREEWRAMGFGDGFGDKGLRRQLGEVPCLVKVANQRKGR